MFCYHTQTHPLFRTISLSQSISRVILSFVLSFVCITLNLKTYTLFFIELLLLKGLEANVCYNGFFLLEKVYVYAFAYTLLLFLFLPFFLLFCFILLSLEKTCLFLLKGILSLSWVVQNMFVSPQFQQKYGELAHIHKNVKCMILVRNH